MSHPTTEREEILITYLVRALELSPSAHKLQLYRFPAAISCAKYRERVSE